VWHGARDPWAGCAGAERGVARAQRLGVDALLASPATADAGGVRALSARGDLCYDIPALTHALRLRCAIPQMCARRRGPALSVMTAARRRARYNEAEADPRRLPGAAGSGELRAACRAALRHAQRANAAAEEAGGQAALVAAWAAATEVAFTRRQAALEAADGGRAEDAALAALAAVTGALAAAGRGEAPRLAPPLARVARSLAARLRERAAGALPGGAGPLPALRRPAAARAVLGQLLAAAEACRGAEAARGPLYGALLAALAGARAPPLAAAPPPLLAALLAGTGAAPGEAAAALEARQAEADAGAAALLRRAGWLAAAAAADALRPGGRAAGRAQALHLLAALVAADDGPGAAEGVHAAGVPARALADLADLAAGGGRGLLAPGPAGAGALAVAEAQLALLLRLTLAGLAAGGRAGPHRLAAAGFVERLAACGALDLTPEEPGGGGGGPGSLRARLGRLAAAALRVVVAALAGAPGAPQVRAAAAEFAAAHGRLLRRALEEAASRGAGGWEPGAVELRLAAASLGLLARLPGAADEPGVRAAALALTERFAAPDARSASPAVLRAAAARDAEAAPPPGGRAGGARLGAAVRAVRAGAAHYLRALTAAGGLTLRIARPPPGGPPCPCLLGLADAAGQAREHLAAAQDERARLLAALAAGGGAAGAGAAGFERGAPAAAAADAEAEVDELHFAAENLLATLFLHLWQRPASELGSPQARAPARAPRRRRPRGAPRLTACACAQDLEQLRRALGPQLDQWERLELPDRDASALQLLARRAKAQLADGAA